MICHHGAGYSGLSFACFAKEVTDLTKGECGALSLDARRHGTQNKDHSMCISNPFQGRTTSTDGENGDLSIDILVADFCAILETIFPDPASAPTFLVRTS